MRCLVALVMCCAYAHAAPRTVVHEVLQLEDRYVPTAGDRKLVDDILAQTKKAVDAQRDRLAKLAPRARALETLALIETTLAGFHFVYPARGFVASMHEGLQPVTLDWEAKQRLHRVPENQRRWDAIDEATVFHVADCDIFSLLYVAIGQDLGLPITLVDLPSFGGDYAHNYVAWQLDDGEWIHWEAMTGIERTAVDDLVHFPGDARAWNAKHKLYARPMTLPEVRGYLRMVSITHALKLGNDADALDQLRAGLELHPTSPTLLNEAAWLLATSPDPAVRDGKAAVVYAERLRELWPTANDLDTVAAAFAAAGRWKDARATQKLAVQRSLAFDPRATNFKQRLTRYEKCHPFVVPRMEEHAGAAWREELQSPHWGNLRVKPAADEPAAPLPDLCR